MVLLIGLRIALPYILLRFVNKELQTIPGYTGHVDDIDVHLIRGAYTIKAIRLDKTGGKIPVPFEISNGEIHYRDFYSDPKVNIFATDIHILAENLSNAKHQPEVLPSTVEATCDSIYSGHADLHMKLNALDTVPTFDVKAELKDMDITRLNDFLSAYGKFTVRKGSIGIYTEAAAKDGKIAGYTKPIIRDLRVVNWQEDKAHPLKGASS